MIIEQHYDDEVLISMLEQSSESGVRDPHIASCTTCTSALDSIRQVTGALHDETVWDRRELAEEPRPTTRETLRSFASAAAVGDGAAEGVVKKLLAMSAIERTSALSQHPEWRTAGVVRRLVAAVQDGLNFSAPADTVGIAALMVDIAESIPARQRNDTVTKLRAEAWREYAYALHFVGSYTPALDAINRCDNYLETCVVADYDLANAKLVRASILAAIEKIDDALSLTRVARKMFIAFGDFRRATIAEMTEAAMLTRTRRYADALPMYLAIAERASDELSRACAMQNAAICCRELSDIPHAKLLFARAVSAFERLNVPAMRAKARWSFGKILVVEREYNQATELLSDVQREFEELGMAHDVALVAIDIAEALLLAERPREVSSLCHAAMDYFSEAKLTYTKGALTALAYLREAAESKSLTTADVSNVRAFIEILPKQPELLFARPA